MGTLIDFLFVVVISSTPSHEVIAPRPSWRIGKANLPFDAENVCVINPSNDRWGIVHELLPIFSREIETTTMGSVKRRGELAASPPKMLSEDYVFSLSKLMISGMLPPSSNLDVTGVLNSDIELGYKSWHITNIAHRYQGLYARPPRSVPIFEQPERIAGFVNVACHSTLSRGLCAISNWTRERSLASLAALAAIKVASVLRTAACAVRLVSRTICLVASKVPRRRQTAHTLATAATAENTAIVHWDHGSCHGLYCSSYAGSGSIG